RSNGQEEVNRATPFQADARDLFERDCAGGEEHRIDRSQIVIFAAQHDKSREQNKVNEPENAKSPAVASDEKPNETAEPKREENRIHDLRLIENEGDRAADHVAMRLSNVVHQFEKWKIVTCEPNQVRQKNQERYR